MNTARDERAETLGADIGSRVRGLRNRAGLSGLKLAAAADVSQPFLSQLESGQSSVAIATLYRLARALGVHPVELLPTRSDHPGGVTSQLAARRLTIALGSTRGPASL